MVKTIVALVLLGHGIGHIMGFLAAWTSIPMGFTDRPWLLGDAAIDSGLGRAFGVIWLVALAGFVAAGVGLLAGQDWWKAAAVAAAVVSLVVILPWWNTVTPGSKLAAVLVDVITLIVLFSPWGDQIK